MIRPLIGITTRITNVNGHRSFGHSVRYSQSVEEAGGIPVLIPCYDSPDTTFTLFSRIDGLIITGGEDIDPKHYRETPHERLGKVSAERDAIELALASLAYKEKKPTLGICRGLQVINVALGGTLFQDLPSQKPSSIEHGRIQQQDGALSDSTHLIKIAAKSRLQTLLKSDELLINSAHHQAIKDLAPGLTVNAVALDGVIEGVENPALPFFLAVQSHPERWTQQKELWMNLFRELVTSAAPHQ